MLTSVLGSSQPRSVHSLATSVQDGLESYPGPSLRGSWAVAGAAVTAWLLQGSEWLSKRRDQRGGLGGGTDGNWYMVKLCRVGQHVMVGYRLEEI